MSLRRFRRFRTSLFNIRIEADHPCTGRRALHKPCGGYSHAWSVFARSDTGSRSENAPIQIFRPLSGRKPGSTFPESGLAAQPAPRSADKMPEEFASALAADPHQAREPGFDPCRIAGKSFVAGRQPDKKVGKAVSLLRRQMPDRQAQIRAPRIVELP